MATFGTIGSLLKNVEVQVENTLRVDVSKYGVDTLTDRKQKDFYDRGTPTQYDRTYEFLNSSVSLYEDSKSSNTRKVLSVFSDTSTQYMPSKHPSWLGDGRSNKNRFIPIWAEFGNNSSLYSYEGSGYFSNFVKIMEDNLKKEMIKGLRKRNIQAY